MMGTSIYVYIKVRKISLSYLKAVIHQPIKSWRWNFGNRSHCICYKSPNVIIWHNLSFLRREMVMESDEKKKTWIMWVIRAQVFVSPLHCQRICTHHQSELVAVPLRLPFLPNRLGVFQPLLSSGCQLPLQNLPIQISYHEPKFNWLWTQPTF